MTRAIPPPLSLALNFLRSAQGWSQKELAEATGIPANLLSAYECGRKTLSRDRLEELTSVLGLPRTAIDTALDFLQTIRGSSQIPGPQGAEGWRVEAVAAEAGRLAAEFARGLLGLLTVESRALEARQLAAPLWRRLKRYPPAQRRLLVEEAVEFRSWALCELVCEESVRAAADSADRALELAELALRIAELSPGEESWRWRLQGYAWAHLGNARRVGSDLRGAEAAFVRAGQLWQAGAAGDPGLLAEARLLDLEASLRRSQTRFAEALELLNRALAAEPEDLKQRLLLNQATVLEALGDFAGAIGALRQAAPFVEAEGDPRLLYALRFNLAVNLCFLAKHGEAEALLPRLRELANGLGNHLDLLRLRWLEGRIAAGLGRRREAVEALSAAREELASLDIAYDVALVSLELAVLYLEAERTAEVKTLARQMAPIFQAQGVPREALAAFKLFRDAAEREAVTLALVRKLVAYFHRAQHDPGLRFEDL
jgi:transcriptional regulator with XRE-family HTH domain